MFTALTLIKTYWKQALLTLLIIFIGYKWISYEYQIMSLKNDLIFEEERYTTLEVNFNNKSKILDMCEKKLQSNLENHKEDINNKQKVIDMLRNDLDALLGKPVNQPKEKKERVTVIFKESKCNVEMNSIDVNDTTGNILQGIGF